VGSRSVVVLISK